MENKEVLHIGVGRCGNAIVDGLVRSNKSLVGLLYNTAANDVNMLDSFLDGTVGVILIPNADGTGKDPKLAKEYALANIDMFEDQLRRYSMSNNFIFYFSMDGGTGSGCSPELIKHVHSIYEDTCTINVVAFIRSKNLSKEQLENVKNCWNELDKLRDTKNNKGIIKSIMIIDNDSRETIEEINMEAVRLINYSYALKEIDDSGSIDTTDMGRYFNQPGYRVVYHLDNKHKDFETALEDAIKNSILLKPNKYSTTDEFIDLVNSSDLLNEEEKKIKIEQDKKFKYKCRQLIGTIQKNKFNLTNVLTTIKAISNNKIGVNDNNVICMSGMDMPLYKMNEVISKLKMASLDLVLKEETSSFNEDIDISDNENSTTKMPGRRKPVRKRKSVDEIFNKDIWRNK